MNTQTTITTSPITPKNKIFDNALRGRLIRIFIREKREYMKYMKQ